MWNEYVKAKHLLLATQYIRCKCIRQRMLPTSLTISNPAISFQTLRKERDNTSNTIKNWSCDYYNEEKKDMHKNNNIKIFRKY